MEPGARRFADSVKAVNVGPPMGVNHYAATGIVSCRYHWYRLTANVYAILKAALSNGWKVVV